jgi:flagellar biosynthetic protein FliR
VELSFAQAQLFFLALTRVLATIIHVPVLGGRLIPNPIKLGLGVLLVVVILPIQPLPEATDLIPTPAFVFAIFRELVIGTLAGFGAVLTFGALQMAGDFIGLGSGFAAAQILNPVSGSTDSVVNQFFVMITTMLFLVLNGHHIFLLALVRTFEVLPVNGPFPNFSSDPLLALFGQLITIGIHLAMPMLGALLLTDITLGLLARVAPQVQVFFLGAPIKIAVGLIGMAIALGVLMPAFIELFDLLGTRMLRLVSN